MKHIHTKAVGVTFDNADGTNRQDIFKELANSLREEYEADELFSGWSKEEQIENGYDVVSEFEDIIIPLSCHRYKHEGKDALYLRCEKGIIGNISADLVTEILKLPNAMFYGEITGGKRHILEDEIKTETVTYGMNVTIEIKENV